MVDIMNTRIWVTADFTKLNFSWRCMSQTFAAFIYRPLGVLLWKKVISYLVSCEEVLVILDTPICTKWTFIDNNRSNLDKLHDRCQYSWPVPDAFCCPLLVLEGTFGRGIAMKVQEQRSVYVRECPTAHHVPQSSHKRLDREWEIEWRAKAAYETATPSTESLDVLLVWTW